MDNFDDSKLDSDNSKLALELLSYMHMMGKSGRPKHIDGAFRGEMFALHYIAKQEAPVLPGEISDEMNVSSARIAQTLNNIEKKGWITRKIDPSDRRRILVELTPEGQKVDEAQRQCMLDKAIQMLSVLGEEDAKEYVRITGKLAKSFSEQICNKHTCDAHDE